MAGLYGAYSGALPSPDHVERSRKKRWVIGGAVLFVLVLVAVAATIVGVVVADDDSSPSNEVAEVSGTEPATSQSPGTSSADAAVGATGQSATSTTLPPTDPVPAAGAPIALDPATPAAPATIPSPTPSTPATGETSPAAVPSANPTPAAGAPGLNPTLTPAAPDGETATESALVAELGNDLWTELPAQLPYPMGEVAAGILVGGLGTPYLVVVGEHESGAPADEQGLTTIYNIPAGSWLNATARPVVGDHHAAEVIDNALYLFGGFSDESGDAVATVQIGRLVPDPDQGVNVEWTLGADAPFVSGSGNSAYINGLVYLCGGIDGQETVDTCAAYNATSDTWSSAVAPMPEGRNHAASCTDGTRMFVFGGRVGRNFPGPVFNETQVFTPGPSGGSWQILEDLPLPYARGGTGKAVYYAGRCYVFGGEVDIDEEGGDAARKFTDDRVSFATDIYDVQLGQWSEGADLPVAMHGIFPVLYDNNIYLPGGGIAVGNSQSVNLLQYDP